MARRLAGGGPAPMGQVLIADFTTGEWELSLLGGSTNLQYDVGSAGGLANGRHYSVDETGLVLGYGADADASDYASVAYYPTALDVRYISQFIILAEWNEGENYGGLNPYIVTETGNTFTNYYNRSGGDGQRKVPRTQAVVWNISEMTKTGTGADLSNIGKINIRLVQSSNGDTANQACSIRILKIWGR